MSGMGLHMILEEIRTNRGVSVREVARQIDESYSTVDRWFNGLAIPRFDQAIKLAQYFKVSLDAFAGREPRDALTRRDSTILRMAQIIGYEEAERRLLLAELSVGMVVGKSNGADAPVPPIDEYDADLILVRTPIPTQPAEPPAAPAEPPRMPIPGTAVDPAGGGSKRRRKSS